MKKIVSKILAACAIASMSLGLADIKPVKASAITYNDFEVSLSMAVDRYVAVNLSQNIEEDKEIVAVASIEEKQLKGTMTIEVATTEAEASDDLGDAIAEETPSTEDVADNTVIPIPAYIDFTGKAMISVNDNVNIRSEATVNSDKVATIGARGLMTVKEKGVEWSLVKSGNCEGYIKNEFLVFDDSAKQFAEKNLLKMAVINATSLRVRKEASENSDCLTVVPNGESYRIIEQGNQWTKIEVDDSVSGYVRNDYLYLSYNTVSAVPYKAPDEPSGETPADTSDDTSDDTTEDVTETPTEEPTEETPSDEPADSAPSSDLGMEIVNYALQFVGNPYVWGGSSLTNGTDCSGFTMSVYAHFGYSLPHSSRAQANCGTEVSLSALQPGDLLFYTNGGTTIGHVALYIGNGQIVHASTSKTGIIVSNAFYSTPCKAVRIIG